MRAFTRLRQILAGYDEVRNKIEEEAEVLAPSMSNRAERKAP